MMGHLVSLLFVIPWSTEEERGQVGYAGQEKGVELAYRILYPADFKGNRNDASQRIVRVIGERFRLLERKSPTISTANGERIAVRIPWMVTKERLAEYKQLVAAIGRFEEREVAEEAILRRWRETKKVPEGWMVIADPKKTGKESQLLVSKNVIITEKDLRFAGKSRSLEGGWQIDMNLTDEGAKRFDAVAARLYAQDNGRGGEFSLMPRRGRTAVLLDGRLLAVPTINAKRYDGQMFLTRGGGFPEKEAAMIAAVLEGGSLPFPLGTVRKGIPVPGVPERETFLK